MAALRSSHPDWRLTLAPAALLRQRATESQAGLTPRQRRLNLRGAFRVSDPAIVVGRDVLVIDDILTTGATARAASQALLRAGARSVWVATLARAQRAAFVRSDLNAIPAGEPLPIGQAGNPVILHPQPASMHRKDQPSF